MYIKQPFDSHDDVSLATGLACLDATRTKESFARDADINVIVEAFGLGHELPNKYEAPRYSDFDEVIDYQSALNAVRAAGERFNELPGHMRERFDHNPQKLMVFLGDKTNLDEAVKLGLVPPPLKAESGVSEPVKPTQPASAGNSSST